MVKKFPSFHGIRRFFSCSQDRSTRLYTESNESSPCVTSYFLKMHFNIILSSMLRFKGGFFLQVSPKKPCIHLCQNFINKEINHHHHHHMSVMELDHSLTRSSLTHLEDSSEVCHDSFCQLGNSVSLPWVVCHEAFCLHVVSSSSCIPVVCLEPVLFLIPFAMDEFVL